jgi:transposase-like protein
MPRRVPHSAELREQAVAAVTAGASISKAAAQFGISKSVVSRWVAAQSATPRHAPRVLQDDRRCKGDPHRVATIRMAELTLSELTERVATTLRLTMRALDGRH